MSNFERLRREAEQRIEYNRRLEAERKRLEAIEVAEAIRRIQEHNRIINERYNEAFLVEPKTKKCSSCNILSVKKKSRRKSRRKSRKCSRKRSRS